MSRGEGEPKVHSNAIHEWEGLVRHMFGKPGEWAWSVDDMLDGLHDEGREKQVTREEGRPSGAVEE